MWEILFILVFLCILSFIYHFVDSNKWECAILRYSYKKLKRLSVIGEGGYGIVKKGYIKGLKAFVAVKEDLFKSDDGVLQNELRVMKYLLRSSTEYPKNIVKLVGIVTQPKLMLIMEYCEFGSLSNVLQSCKYFIDQTSKYSDNEFNWSSNNRVIKNKAGKRNISTRHLLIWAFQIACAMEVLHSQGILHGDLTTHNVLLHTNNIVKLADFGLAQHNHWDEEIFSIMKSSDVKSFGFLLYRLFAKSHDTPIQIKQKPEHANAQIYNIILRCSEEKSPNFSELKQNIKNFLPAEDVDFVTATDNYGGSFKPAAYYLS